MSRRITPGAPRFDRSGIPIAVLMAAVIVVAAGCREDKPHVPATVEFTPPATPPPPGRPEDARQCADGTWSSATGSGACSHHGGVRHG